MKNYLIIFIKILKRLMSILKMGIWKILYGKKIRIGKMSFFYPRTHIIIELNGKIVIGDNCFFNCNCSINSMQEISIGDNCIFGENVAIYDHNHKYNDGSKLIREQGYSFEKITIGNNCWIGSNVTILKGAKIGDNVVIGAGVVVHTTIPDNSIVIFNQPIMTKKRRGINETISKCNYSGI
ncbi:MAG: acyltransferase [Lachnospiraceae bacterium]|nr:acyltransferase [Lachnospiraceae bacterium]